MDSKISIDETEELLPLLPIHEQRKIEKVITPIRVKEILAIPRKNQKWRNHR